jgi:biopolymer transport protein ExbB
VERISTRTSIVGKFLDGAVAELQASAGTISNDGLKERIASRLERIEAAGARRIARGTGVLATIGATAPFVGLFGTVWGIMNSFIGISKSQTTNLAVVAPGIAEALLATAFGLAAAIPAVVIYNSFSRSIAGYRVLMGDASAEVLRLVGRDLDQRSAMSAQPTTNLPAPVSRGATTPVVATM